MAAAVLNPAPVYSTTCDAARTICASCAILAFMEASSSSVSVALASTCCLRASALAMRPRKRSASSGWASSSVRDSADSSSSRNALRRALSRSFAAEASARCVDCSNLRASREETSGADIPTAAAGGGLAGYVRSVRAGRAAACSTR